MKPKALSMTAKRAILKQATQEAREMTIAYLNEAHKRYKETRKDESPIYMTWTWRGEKEYARNGLGFPPQFNFSLDEHKIKITHQKEIIDRKKFNEKIQQMLDGKITSISLSDCTSYTAYKAVTQQYKQQMNNIRSMLYEDVRQIWTKVKELEQELLGTVGLDQETMNHYLKPLRALGSGQLQLKG